LGAAFQAMQSNIEYYSYVTDRRAQPDRGLAHFDNYELATDSARTQADLVDGRQRKIRDDENRMKAEAILILEQ
jgi:hypothetical protein